MEQYNISKVVENYYKASNSLTEIGTMQGIPEELEQLTISTSEATSQIIKYINSNK